METSSNSDNSNGSHLEGKIKNELSCSICLLEFHDPRILPCLHTFCSGCLDFLPKARDANDHKTLIIACPLCRRSHLFVPEGFPKNFWVSNLQNIVGGGQKPAKVYFCSECAEQKEAVAKCGVCEGEDAYLCQLHVDSHKISKRTVAHPIEMLPNNDALKKKEEDRLNEKKKILSMIEQKHPKNRETKEIVDSDDDDHHFKDSDEEVEVKKVKHSSEKKKKKEAEHYDEDIKKAKQKQHSDHSSSSKSSASSHSHSHPQRPVTLTHYNSNTKRRPKLDDLITKKWGVVENPRYQIVMRYWDSTRSKEHWMYLYRDHSRKFIHMLDKGYMEPIPTQWVQCQYLAYQYPEGSAMSNLWETRGEKRLYYVLNNIRFADGTKPPRMRPIRNVQELIRRGNARNARAKPIPEEQLSKYSSNADAFRQDSHVQSNTYSSQVGNFVYQARAAALQDLAQGLKNGSEHLETMVLLDVSGSMTWDPSSGVRGPDGVMRYHDQPSNISLVKNLLHRALAHMIPRAQKEHPKQKGIDCVTFSNLGRYVGQLSYNNFENDWYEKVKLGGGTQIMTGWQTVKTTYFTEMKKKGHGSYDSVFGWQATPGMPKLSLLVFLDGEANDMDEFELELLGESWAYVTIALVGMENCPHHHAHAIELERVAQFNPHIGFFDVHGRVCERMVIEDVLASVYPVDAPDTEEILSYDL